MGLVKYTLVRIFNAFPFTKRFSLQNVKCLEHKFKGIVGNKEIFNELKFKHKISIIYLLYYSALSVFVRLP
jgi:hypothetical protein